MGLKKKRKRRNPAASSPFYIRDLVDDFERYAEKADKRARSENDITSNVAYSLAEGVIMLSRPRRGPGLEIENRKDAIRLLNKYEKIIGTIKNQLQQEID